MQSIRSVLFTAAAITITLVAFVFTASLALALAGIAAIIAVGSAIAAKLNGRPRAGACARTRQSGKHSARDAGMERRARDDHRSLESDCRKRDEASCEAVFRPPPAP